jgi:hypothetical protein
MGFEKGGAHAEHCDNHVACTHPIVRGHSTVTRHDRAAAADTGVCGQKNRHQFDWQTFLVNAHERGCVVRRLESDQVVQWPARRGLAGRCCTEPIRCL